MSTAARVLRCRNTAVKAGMHRRLTSTTPSATPRSIADSRRFVVSVFIVPSACGALIFLGQKSMPKSTGVPESGIVENENSGDSTTGTQRIEKPSEPPTLLERRCYNSNPVPSPLVLLQRPEPFTWHSQAAMRDSHRSDSFLLSQLFETQTK